MSSALSPFVATSALIQNPVLPGFHPDPSIARAGDTFYIATSTFQWFPGVRIHQSSDLVHWTLAGDALTRTQQLDMRGLPDSAGVWAPCLSFDQQQKRFYLIYTVVQSRPGYMSDAPNFLVTADDPAGPWSDPVFLNARGFDPSLFHDDDGRKWLVQMQADHRPGKDRFAGILLQEYDDQTQKLINEPKLIFTGTDRGLTEGPHLYKRGGYYYLMTAEGGTSYQHAVTMARSEKIDGPYEIDPQKYVLTSDGSPGAELQKAGHASLVETQAGDWYLAHLASRPVGDSQRCILGRETSIQKVEWNEAGWLRLTGGGNTPQITTPAPPQTEQTPIDVDESIRFDSPTLDLRLNTLREPADPSWLSLGDRPGWLRMHGRSSLQALSQQSLVGRRAQHHSFRAETRIDYGPSNFQQMAGIAAYYDTLTHHYLHITHDEEAGKCLRLMSSDLGELSSPLASPIPLDPEAPCYLAFTLDGQELQFSHSDNGQDWLDVGPRLDSTILSDDHAPNLGFTGMYIALCTQDLTGIQLSADYEFLSYENTMPCTQH